MSTVRATLRTALAANGCRVDHDQAVLLANELVVNALRHGEPSPIEVVVQLRPASLRVQVSDRSPSPPVPIDPGEWDEHGRGLLLVRELATAWGSSPIPGDGKAVWFETSGEEQ